MVGNGRYSTLRRSKTQSKYQFTVQSRVQSPGFAPTRLRPVSDFLSDVHFSNLIFARLQFYGRVQRLTLTCQTTAYTFEFLGGADRAPGASRGW